MDAFTIECRTLEPHQLERRFAALRLPEPKRLAALERSLAQAGQLQPLIAVPAETPAGAPAPFVLLDGYRRLEALARLERDTAEVAVWDCPVADALPRVLAQAQARAWAPVEEALVLRALATDYGLSQHELARRTGRDVSWVNRRLALLSALPETLLEAICRGTVSTWAAARILAPLARANEGHATELLEALSNKPLSTRELARWHEHYTASTRATRERLVAHPHLFVAALANESAERDASRLREGPEGQWHRTLERIAGQLNRLRQVLPGLCVGAGLPPELVGAVQRVHAAWQALEQALPHADGTETHCP